MNHKIITICVMLFFAFPTSLAFAESSLCTDKGYSIGFFNGVWNTQNAALTSMYALAALKGYSANGHNISYELFYNATGSEAGGTAMQDLAETFIQRANELDNSGELAKHFELLVEVLNPTGNMPLWQRIILAIPSASSFFDALNNEIKTKYIAAMSDLLSNPPTEANYATQNTRLDALKVEGQMLLLVAHSQGNLFVNHAYDYIAPKIGSSSVATVHIAPASPTLRGGYVLANIDLVINGLRVFGSNTVPAANITLPLSTADASGHTLIGTYLDPTRAARATVNTLMANALNALQAPAATGNVGAFTITLTWNGTGDEDLHTYEPNGMHVYYGNTIGLTGYLDVDNVTAYGPEHYYASCDPTVLQTGTYPFGVNNFNGASGELATVQVSSSLSGVLFTKTIDTGPVIGPAGNNYPIIMGTVTVSKDSTGQFKILVQ